MGKWSLSLCEESVWGAEVRKEKLRWGRKEGMRISCRQTGGRMSPVSQGSVQEQTVTLAPAAHRSCWAFLLFLSDLLSDLTRAYRHALILLFQRHIAGFQKFSAFQLLINFSLRDKFFFRRSQHSPASPAVTISFNHNPVSYTVTCRTLCSPLQACSHATEGTAAGGELLQPLQPLAAPGRHSATLPTAGTSNRLGPQAGHMGIQGMAQSGACAVKSFPIYRGSTWRKIDRWLNNTDRERWMNKRSILPSAVQSSGCIKKTHNRKTTAWKPLRTQVCSGQ